MVRELEVRIRGENEVVEGYVVEMWCEPVVKFAPKVADGC